MFNGQVGKGAFILIFGVVFGVLGLLTMGLLSIPAWALWVAGLIDAVCVGNKLNQGKPVTHSEWF